LKINGLIDNPKWKSIPCKCNHDSVETEYPIFSCIHCKCQADEDSMPRENFTVIHTIIDKNGKPTGEREKKIIEEITITRSTDGYDSIIGWSF
jgi:hypothetical protein